ncbi:type II toxin-antitoxin system HicB family antitoxin [Methanoculleus nereidis]|uniref:type II toxin-antitoxin system HicB family antitoxin n=1 Tax=Methanoculleus nereidis TaxID=2735141 RepID=UPI00374D50A4
MLPGPRRRCVATGATREEVEERMHEAIEFHIEGLREDGLPIPPSRSSAIYVAVGRG